MEFENKSFAFGSLNLFSAISNPLLTLLYPQACQICEKSVELKLDGFICRDCWEKTRIFTGAEIVCRKCSAFLKTGSTEFEVFCRRCETDDYDSAHSVGFYEKALAVSILNLKKQPFVSLHLRKLIANSFTESLFQDANLIVPVPLSTHRMRERGFNQASIIAQIIAEDSGLPISENSLRRTLHTTKHRAGMDRKSRFESVENSFEIKKPRVIEGKNILLVDDVFTSGATVSNCAKMLKKVGAKKVYVFTIARAF